MKVAVPLEVPSHTKSIQGELYCCWSLSSAVVRCLALVEGVHTLSALISYCLKTKPITYQAYV